MIKKISLALLATTLLSTGLFAKADRGLVADYMQVSGTKIAIESMGEQVAASIQQTSMMYGTATDKRKIAFLQTVFNGDDGVESVENYLVEHFNNSEIKKLNQYYNSALGQKVTQAAIDASEPSAQADLYRFMASLQSNPPSRERTAIIKSLVSELHMVESVENIFDSVLTYLSTLKGDNRISSSQISQLHTMLHQAFEQQMFLTSLYAYRNISDSELEQVINFYNTDAGEKELKIVTKALAEMLSNGFKKAMSE